MSRAAVAWVMCALVPVTASAFTAFPDPNNSTRPVRWPANSVQVVLQQNGSDDISDGSDLAAVRAAIRNWNTTLQGRFTLTEGTPIASSTWGADGVNAIIFVESGWPGAADGALGTTLPHVHAGNPSTFDDADVLLNGTEAPWVTNGDPLGIDVQSIASHELGHLLGLWHAWHSDVVMYTGARRGTTFRHVLADDDKKGARYVTPGAFTCTIEAECPLLVRALGGQDTRLVCQGGACVAGQAGYGAECVDNTQCQSGLCLRDPWSANGFDPGACTRTCSTAAPNCPGGDACNVVGGSPVCVPGRGCVADGDCAGGSNVKCLMEFDGRFRCNRLCVRDGNCTAGDRCIDQGYGAGVCQTPGQKANGAVCVGALECAGLACRGGVDSLACATAPPRDDGGMSPDVPYVPPDSGNPTADAGNAMFDSGQFYPPYEEPPQDPPPRQQCACLSPRPASPAWSSALIILVTVSLARRRR